jgi:Protein of unknown function (DUF3800)
MSEYPTKKIANGEVLLKGYCFCSKPMTLKSNKEEFALFLDESGSPKPNPKDAAPFFAMGGILVKRADEALIQSEVEEFKNRWDISQDTPLHGNEIRSKKKRFAWLGKLSPAEQQDFMEDLTETIIKCPITVHACVISRSGYHNRYLEQYGQNTWEMMKSAFSILIERSAKYAARQNGAIMVYYEKAGKTEDKLLEQYFRDLRTAGNPFSPETSSKYAPLDASALSDSLRGIEGGTKRRAELQIADICLYPVVRSKDQPENRAFVSMREHNLLVDCRLKPDDINSLGIKYYCFDNA